MEGLEHIEILVDLCGFWPPDPNEKDAIKRLLELETIGIIGPLEITEATEAEQEQIGTPSVIRKQSSGRIIAVPPDCTTLEQRQVRQDIRNTLFDNKLQLTNSDKIDISNIYTAWHHKYFCFVTYDQRHILSKTDIIWEKFRVRCVTPKKCLRLVMDEILENSKHCSTKLSLPT